MRLHYFHGFGPRQTPDFLFVADIVQANRLAATARGTSGPVSTSACGSPTGLLELAAEINRLLGPNVGPEPIAPRAGDVRHRQADIAPAPAELGYQPHAEVREGLRRCLHAFPASASASFRAPAGWRTFG